MSKKIIAIVMLAAFPCWAQVAIPEDAPVVLNIQEGEIVVLDPNDQPVKAKVGSGFYINKPAAKEITGMMAQASKELVEKTDKVNELNKKVAQLETERPNALAIVLVIAGSFLLGVGTGAVIVGVATAKQ